MLGHIVGRVRTHAYHVHTEVYAFSAYGYAYQYNSVAAGDFLAWMHSAVRPIFTLTLTDAFQYDGQRKKIKNQNQREHNF